MEIQRQFYLNELVRKQRNGFVKVITGLRQRLCMMSMVF